MEHRLNNADWDGIRVFLAAASAGSFRKTAEELGTATNTVRRVIERLEDQLGFALFYREAGGLRLTPEGRRISEPAREVERSITDMWRVAATSADTMKGPIRLAVTEGLGAFWLIPQLEDYLHHQQKLVRIELQCAMRSVDVLRFEADISIQLQEPTNPDLTVKRLGYLYLVPFASPEYVSRAGMARKFSDLPQHLMVEQETDQLKSYGLDELFGPGSTDRMVRLKTNFSSAHYWAVAKGLGIGLLPSYARMIGGRVVHMEMDWSLRVPIYMACHPEVLKSARHRHFADWLSECFSAQKYPWFGPDYMTPAEIEVAFDRAQLRPYFEGFVATA